MHRLFRPATLLFFFFSLISGAKAAETPPPKFTFHGFLDMGFTVQQSANENTPQQSWDINEIELQIEHTQRYVRSKIALNIIPSTLTLNAAGMLDHLIQEAFIELSLPFAGQWQTYITAGRFYAPQGWDAVNGVDRYQYTASFANTATPNTFMGLRWGVRQGSFDLSLTMTNGWDNITELDRQPTVVLASAWGAKNLDISASVTYGPEPTAMAVPYISDSIVFFDLQLTLKLLSERLLVAAEGSVALHGSGKLWYVVLGCIHWKFHKKVSATLRYSRVDDPDSLLGSGVAKQELSTALLALPLPGIKLFFEYRLDMVDGKTNNHFVGLKGIYYF